jgi:hypothetical protein
MRTKHYAFAAASVVLLVLVLATPSLAAQGNSKPCLCNPKISPMTGVAKTVYVATLSYTDPDGDAAAKVEVYIDNTAYPMKRVGRGTAARATYRARLTLPPGEHSYYFYAEDVRGASERFPRYGAYNGPFVGNKKPMNRLPVLSEGGVYFDYGSNHSIYTYAVHYKDMDCPPSPKVKVVVDGISHDMKLHSGKANDGTYHYQTMLPTGSHAYYFMAKDRNGDCVSLPSAGFLRGPEVLAMPNTPPALLDQRNEPKVGGTTNCWGFPTRYNFIVHYNDVDGDDPPVALIYIDNVPHSMKRIKGNAANGLYAYKSAEFLSNMHTYYYYFEDGNGASARMPEVGAFHGPVVTR